VKLTAGLHPLKNINTLASPLDYGNMSFAYWDVSDSGRVPVTLSAQSSTAAFTMPDKAISAQAFFRTNLASGQTIGVNPLGNISLTQGYSEGEMTNYARVSFTPTRDFTVTLLPAADDRKYAAYPLANRALLEYRDALETAVKLRNVSFPEDALDGHNIISPEGEPSYDLTPATWNQFCEEYMAKQLKIQPATEQEIQALKDTRLFYRQYGDDTRHYPLCQYFASKIGDPSAASSDNDIIIADINAANADITNFLKNPGNLTADEQNELKAELGNTVSLEFLTTDAAGTQKSVMSCSTFEFLLSAYVADYRELRSSYYEEVWECLLFAGESGCDATITFKAGKTYDTVIRFSDTPLNNLSGAESDSLTAVLTLNEAAKSNSAGTPVITTYKSTATRRAVEGISNGGSYAANSTLNITAPVTGLEGSAAPKEDERRQVPVSYSLDGGAEILLGANLSAAISLSTLTIGNHTLTINYKGQTYIESAWLNNGAAFAEQISFTVTPPVVYSPAKVNLTFDTNGGSAVTGAAVTIGTKPDLSGYTTSKKGFRFGGWFLDKALTEQADGTSVTRDTTLYAKWLPMNLFTDVSGSEWFAEALDWAVENGIVNGVTPTTFGPGLTGTRAQVLAMLWRASGSPDVSGASPFTDVQDPGAWYYKAVLWAAQKGAAQGYEGKFNPDRPITRAELITLLWRLAGSPEPKSQANPFTDVAQKDYYYKAVLWAHENGIAQGMKPTAFDPAGPCTRAQLVTFLWRYFSK
jgi:uncharacterized repeat protein (TIGR02543 family)